MVPGTAPSPRLSLELSLQPNPRMASIVRRLVEESFAKLGSDPDVVSRLSLATHELLENAAKYSVGDSVQLGIQFDPSSDCTRTRLTNETTPVHRARLRDRIRLLQSAAESSDLYQTLMRRAYEAGEASGLGLARIRSEGGMALSMEEDETTVTIVADFHLPRDCQHG